MAKKILKFNGQLIDVMGEKDARCSWGKELGLGVKHIPQMSKRDGDTDEEFTLMEVVDESKCQKYLNHPDVEVLTVAEANAVIAEKFKPKYSIYNDTIAGINLTEKMNQQKEKKANGEVVENKINFDEMLPEWTPAQEAEYLYNKGISGIRRIEPPKGFEE